MSSNQQCSFLFQWELEQVRSLQYALFWWFLLLCWLYSSTKSIISGTQQLHKSAISLTSKWKERSLIMCHHLPKWPALSWMLVINLRRESERRGMKVQIERAHHLFYNQFNNSTPGGTLRKVPHHDHSPNWKMTPIAYQTQTVADHNHIQSILPCQPLSHRKITISTEHPFSFAYFDSFLPYLPIWELFDKE